MSSRNALASDSWMDARVEAYADGALPPDEHRRFARTLAGAPRWQRAVDQAQAVRDALHEVPVAPCPDAVVDCVLRARRADAVRPSASAERPPARRGRPRLGWRPALVTSALVALIVVVAFLGRPPAPAAPEPAYTEAEVEAAEAQVRWTLAYLARVGERTGQELQETVRKASTTGRDAADGPS